ncbi:site-specific DNA-methyltransferase [Flavobacterium sp. xlx-214]|uniref:DNA-methyltransferase n=1 Tax=unclassified Flavobacterium TaxID=196869 RepID=UPI0013D1C63A|nr:MULTISPECIES: site-specific DNA-methyltransferase [unclassified Flavobacterium]MBA5791732.1 site-specific DNA-methyltransferase [Flavobacterium sp. xlx-221]QMI82971.1 site-specific DNA-methyltransferase [Flavobacterium sp. xlx-214]
MIEINKIYQGDCIKEMQKMENESVDLIIADPPYNLNKDFGNSSDKWNDVEEWITWSKKWLDVAITKLKPTGSIFVYGIHHYLCHLHVYLYQKELKYRRQIIWYYENGFSGYKNSPSANYEPILWFSKTDEYTYHQIREPYKSEERLKNKIIKNGKIWTPHPDGKHAGDVWNIPVLAGKRFANEKVDHPTQKPLAICDRIIKHFSNENDLILIPFGGSGSECVSAISNNRNFIAYEKNKEYIKIANHRLNELEINKQVEKEIKTNGIFVET